MAGETATVTFDRCRPPRAGRNKCTPFPESVAFKEPADRSGIVPAGESQHDIMVRDDLLFGQEEMQGSVASLAENRVSIAVDSPGFGWDEIKREPVPGVRELTERVGSPGTPWKNRERDGKYVVRSLQAGDAGDTGGDYLRIMKGRE